MAKAKTYYHVAPRYTCGSPAMVDRFTAERVATQESEVYHRYLDNPEMCPEETVRCMTGNLERIAYSTIEVGGKMEVRDLITGQGWSVPLRQWSGFGSFYERTDLTPYRTRWLP